MGLLVISFVVFLGSCQKEMTNDNLKQQDQLSAATKKKDQKKPVPFKGVITATSSGNETVGTGEGTHVGRFTYASQDNFDKFPYIICTVIFTAANGDQIFGTQTGFAQDMGNGLAKVDFDNTNTGGTGRFDGATGSLKIHVIVNTVQGTASATFDGTITY